MRSSRPDLSNHEVDLDLLSRLFPQISPFVRLIGGNKKYDRSNAIFGIIFQVVILFAAAAILTTASVLLVKLQRIIPSPEVNKILIALIALPIGLPSILIAINGMNQIFDLFYLIVTGNNFNTHGNSLKPVKTVMLCFGFVAGFFLSGLLLFQTMTYVNARQKLNLLREEQKEFFLHLDKGREAWNKYITAGPMHHISFSGSDLSKRSFNGFFFHSVNFNNCDLTDTTFDDCNLGYADFNEANCLRTSFKNSYLKGIEFKNTDLEKADFTGAFGKKADFFKAKISKETLANLKKPENSRWSEVNWSDYHTDEWLKSKGFYVGRKKSKKLKY